MALYPSQDVLALTLWGAKWLKFGFNMVVGNTPEAHFAQGLLLAFDNCNVAPEALLVLRSTSLMIQEETYVAVDAKEMPTEGQVDGRDLQLGANGDTLERLTRTAHHAIKKTVRIKKGHRTTFAMTVAKRAYVKFGARPLTEANTLVVRKWIVKLIADEYKDLRVCDQALVIDRATFLSFIPTMAWNNYKFIFHGKNAVTDRVAGENLFSKIAQWASPSK